MRSYAKIPQYSWFVAAFLLIGAAARMDGLAAESLWLDELFTTYFTDPAIPLRDIFTERILRDVHPPTYYLAIYFWRDFFGSSELALRSFSLLAGLLLLLLAVGLTRGWLEPRTRALLLTLLATSEGLVLYAQEARSYALLLLFSTAATLLFFRLVEARRKGGSLHLPSLLWLAAACSLASFTHFFGILLAGALHGLLLLQSAVLRRDALPVIASGLLVLLPFSAWLIYQADYIHAFHSGWIETSVPAVVRSLGAFLLRAFGSFAAVAVMCLLLAIAGWRRFRREEALSPRRLLFDDVFLSAAVPGLVFSWALAISLSSPVLTSRNLLVALPVFLFGAARLLSEELLSSARPDRTLRLKVGLLAIGSLLALSLLATPGKEEWKAVADLIRKDPACRNATLLVVGDSDSAFDHVALYRYYLSDRRDIGLVDSKDRRGARAALPLIEGSPCPVKLWYGHTPRDALPQLERELAEIGLRLTSFERVSYNGNLVLTKKR